LEVGGLRVEKIGKLKNRKIEIQYSGNKSETPLPSPLLQTLFFLFFVFFFLSCLPRPYLRRCARKGSVPQGPIYPASSGKKGK